MQKKSVLVYPVFLFNLELFKPRKLSSEDKNGEFIYCETKIIYMDIRGYFSGSTAELN